MKHLTEINHGKMWKRSGGGVGFWKGGIWVDWL